MTKVVHCKRDEFDVYIGRGSIWGNPFVIGRDGERDEVIALYRKYLWNRLNAGDSEIGLYELASLHNRKLGCYCSPAPCHGDVLAKAAAWAVGELQG